MGKRTAPAVAKQPRKALAVTKRPPPAPTQKWPADRVERRPIDELIPYARNARTHSDAQVAQIAASMKEWGWTMPVLADEAGMIIAGHGRILAARQLGFTTVPVMVAEGWSDAQKRAYVLADNQLTLNAGWDEKLLSNELRGLNEAGFDLGLVGFPNLDQLLAERTEGLTDPDAAPPLPEKVTSVLGDIWLLGRHRIGCGDSTSATFVDQVLAGAAPHLMVTDPPYGVSYDPGWRAKAGLADKTADGVVLNDDQADWRDAWSLFAGDVAYVWHGGLHDDVVARSLKDCGFGIRAQIVWVKTRPVISRGAYHWQHEPAFLAEREVEGDAEPHLVYDHDVASYAVRLERTGHWHGGRKQSTVWMIEHLKSDTGHGTQKPVECMKRPIENHSVAGDAIYEPFSGSGTTIIAAEMTGRSCLALELNPAYVDVAVKRWQEFTGKQAVHAENGRTFDELSATAIAA